MNINQLTYPAQINQHDLRDTVAAIGFFDGIHKGHKKVINKAVEIVKKERKQSAVISFHPHPSVILKNKTNDIRYLTTLTEKKAILSEMGIEQFYIITFNKPLSKLLPEEFVEHFIIGLHITHLVAGFDYTFGHKGAGNMENIIEMSQNKFTTTVVEKLENDATKISSTRIRHLLDHGLVGEIPPLLGRTYQTTGKVITGDRRGGSQLGFPTANLHIPEDKYLPKQGVYAVKVHYKDRIYNGMANLGVVPTFIDDRTEPKVEVNIFDFDQNIYGEQLTIEWHQFIREEKKFSGIDAIVAQLNKDEQAVKNYFD